MKHNRRLGHFAIAMAGMVVLGACGGDGGGGGNSTTIDQTQAAVVGDVAATQISSMTSSMVNFNSSAGSLGGGFFAPSTATGRLIDGVMKAIPSPEHRQAFAMARLDPNCAPTPDDETDTDLDGIPDHTMYVFDCSYTNQQDGSSFTVTGTIHLFDSQDAANGFGFDINFEAFRFALSVPGQGGPTVTEVIVNGFYNVDVLAALAGASQDVSFVFRVNGRRVFLTSWDWAIDFTPTGTIDFAAEDLPAGEWTINGDFLFAGEAGQDNGDWAFTLNTTAPLVYDGVCVNEPPFESGTIEGAILGHTSVGFTINYTGCGQVETITAFDNNS